MTTVTQYRLTTTDNPYDPFDDYPAWYSYDMMKGYRTGEYLARIVYTSEELSDADQALATKTAIDEIIAEDVEDLYVRVSKEVEVETA